MLRLLLRSRNLERAVKACQGGLGPALADDRLSAIPELSRLASGGASGPSESDAPPQQPVKHTQLLTAGSYTTSDWGAAVRSAQQQQLPDGVESVSAGRQLYVDGATTTSRADPATSSSSSEDEESRRGEAGDINSQLLEAALAHVREKGWTVDAIQQGAADLGLSRAAAGVFERPQGELVKFFVDKCNRDLGEKLRRHEADLAGMGTTDRVRTAVKWRLEMLIPVMDTWPQALAVHTSPGSLPTALRQVASLVDDIWYAAGDASADMDWYTKRAMLAGVYAATEAYMLTDYSPGYADTWEALDRRLEDVATLGKLSGRARATADHAVKGIGAAIQWAQSRLQGGPGPHL